MCRRPYDTDLTDPEWEHLEPLVPVVKPGGRPPIHSRREILNGIFYAVRSGCAWKLLPHDLPPWRTVYHYFWSWRRNGTWEKIHASIRAAVLQAAGRDPEGGKDYPGCCSVVITGAVHQKMKIAHVARDLGVSRSCASREAHDPETQGLIAAVEKQDPEITACRLQRALKVIADRMIRASGYIRAGKIISREYEAVGWSEFMRARRLLNEYYSG